MSAFIYVFNEDDRDKLLSLGYTLLKSNTDSGPYIFLNNSNQSFANSSVKFALSDTITF